MKQFRLILAAAFLLLMGNQMMGQCTPDPNGPTAPGIYPSDTIPSGEIGVAYSTVIQLVIPRDTTISLAPLPPITGSFCSFKLDTFTNLAEGLTYECDVPGCEWIVDHNAGVVTRGCVKISGTPTSRTPDSSLIGAITITPGFIDSTDLSCDPDSFRTQFAAFWPIISALLTQNDTFYFAITGVGVGIDNQLTAADLDMKIVPNPINGAGQLLFTLEEHTDAQIEIVDLLGRRVQTIYSGPVYSGKNNFPISNEGLASGLYLMRISLDHGKHVISQKMTIQR